MSNAVPGHKFHSPTMMPVIFFLVWVLSIALIFWLSVLLSEGHVIYTIDDPYIHLAVAENIPRGTYGINLDESSSPSSSALYPFVLVLTEMLGLGEVGPLLINLAAMGLSVWLLLDFFWSRAVPANGKVYVFPFVMSVLLIFFINALALPMTGMEHSLHVLAVILVMRGLVSVAETGRIGGAFAVATVVMPLIRFEGIALSGAVLLALVFLRRWRVALVLGSSLAALLAGYLALMLALDLPLLPSSVMVKSGVAANVEQESGLLDLARDLFANLKRSMTERTGLDLAVAGLLLLSALRPKAGRWRKLTSPEGLVVLVGVLAIAAHLAAGKNDLFQRYQIYVVAVAAMALIYVFRDRLAALQSDRAHGRQLVILLLLTLLVWPAVKVTYLAPAASRAIYEQQFQMHRFATGFFPRRVAVNDLGWVSYRNDSFVLDLVGLGSERVRKMRFEGRFDSNAIERLAEDNGVDFAMIYADWYEGRIPESWCLVAVLVSEPVTAPYGEVSIYSTREETREELRGAIAEFRPSLPKRVRLRDETCESYTEGHG